LRARFRERLGLDTQLHFVPRGGVPRFSYKAARVVDVDAKELENGRG